MRPTSRNRSVWPSACATGSAAVSSRRRCSVARRGSGLTARCSWTPARGLPTRGKGMSSLPDLPRRARLALAALLLLSAWGLPRLPGLATLGGTLVPLAAGILGLAFLVAGRRPLGLWSDSRLRPVPAVSRGIVVGCLLATALIVDGNVMRAAALGSVDVAAVVALLAGTAAWAATAARAPQRPLGRWYLAAAAAALAPMLVLLVILQPRIALRPFVAPTIFFL